jgi:three-Cys-motif partner protein
VSPPFDHFYFIDMNPNKTAHLATLCRGRRDVDIVTDDATSYLTQKLLPTIQYKKFNRALCLLDPYGLHLDWDVMFQAGQSKAIDLFLNFPVMDMNRNAIWRAPENAPKDGIERMSRFWGDESWRQAAYIESDQGNLFSGRELVKQDNAAIVKAFQTRLRAIAGFEFVPEPCRCAIATRPSSIICFSHRKSRSRKRSSRTSFTSTVPAVKCVRPASSMRGKSCCFRQHRVINRRKRFGQKDVEQAPADILACAQTPLQPLAQGHQLIHLSDNALLFGEGWDWCREVSKRA